jgi:hypothetical protein
MRIFHGENIIASRSSFLKCKEEAIKNGLQPVYFDFQQLTLADLATSVGSYSLLGGVNAVFIENFYSLRKTGSLKKDVVAYLESHTDAEIYLWESKDVSSQLKNYSSEIILFFKLPTQLFVFLDTFSPQILLPVLENIAPEQLLSLIAKQIQKLIQVKTNQFTGPSWQMKKLLHQSEKYSLPCLLGLHDKLVKIDQAQKNSSSPQSLSSALELWTLRAVQ